MSEQGLLIVISGPSGVGKDTCVQALLAKDKRFTLSVSATTRASREGETEGKEYYFVSREQFEDMIAQGAFLEHAIYNGNLYGTPKGAVAENLAQGKHVILIIEVAGAAQLRTQNLGAAVFIFMMPPSWATLNKRLAGRGTETPEMIAQRTEIALVEMRAATAYDYVVVSDTVEQCVGDLLNIVRAEQCRVKNRGDLIEDIIREAENSQSAES